MKKGILLLAGCALALLKGHVAINISSGSKELDGRFAEALRRAIYASSTPRRRVCWEGERERNALFEKRRGRKPTPPACFRSVYYSPQAEKHPPNTEIAIFLL